MAEDNQTVLCGGTLLILLSQHKKGNCRNRPHGGDVSDGTSDSALLWNLCEALYPICKSKKNSRKNVYQGPKSTPTNDKKFLDNIKNQVGEYKMCNQNSVSLIPLTEGGIIDHLSFGKIGTSYFEAQEKMKRFVIDKIAHDHYSQNLLAAAIIETIMNDESIKENEVFFCLKNSPFKMQKKDLRNAINLDLPSLLIGASYYIFTKNVINTTGKKTVDKWLKKETSKNDKTNYQFSSDIGIRLADEKPNLVKIPYYGPDDDNPSDSLKDISVKIIKQNYEKLNTFLDIYEQKEFVDIFVCNDISPKNNSKKITNVTLQKLMDYSKFILLTGAPGIGKTMMLRHLLLDACNEFKFIGKLPIYISLWDYQNSSEELSAFFFRKYQSIGRFGEYDEFLIDLDKGAFIFLLDGLDEIPENLFFSFTEKFSDFASKYFGNMFIVTSRNEGNTTYLSKFLTFEICPFRKEQALSLIEKLSAKNTNTELKDLLEKDIELTYDFFTLTPLFLTLMIKNYSEFKDIPKTQHIYFDQLYNVLFRELEKSKGHDKRILLTGLNAKQFETIFSEFCAISFLDDKISFTDYEFDKYFEKINQQLIKTDHYIDPADFRDDLTETLGLMVREGNQIRFWHKSFQEYFCALYYYKLPIGNLKERCLFFEKMDGKPVIDNAFTIYRSMVSENEFDAYVMVPYESYLVTKCLKENGYWTFLCKEYQTISYNENDIVLNPFSSLYKEIFFDKNQNFVYGNCYHFPQHNEFLMDTWVKYREGYCNPDCIYKDRFGMTCYYIKRNEINIEDLSCLCRSNYSEDDIVRKEYTIDFATVIAEPKRYKDLIEYLEKDDFVLMKEYRELLEEYKTILRAFL